MNIVDNSLFPIRMGIHIFLGILALLVFGLQFLRYRKSHHLILALAMPCTLLPYAWDNMNFFYGVGVAEFVALILSFILSVTVDRTKNPEPDTESEEESSEKENVS